MKYLVTGGAGFIGSHLVDELMSLKNEVTVVDNLSSGKLEFLRNNIGKPGFTFINGDMVSSKIAGETVRDCDVVFHLSANPDARKGITDTRYDLEQEVIVTYNVLEAMRINGVGKIVFASSSTIYGETPVVPLSENHGPVLPISIYGACKLAAEGLISAFCNSFNMQSWICRFANVVGGRSTHGVIFDFINKLNHNKSELEILGNGTQCKPYIHVDDCVAGMLFVLSKSNNRVNVYNLGCDTFTDVKHIAMMLVKAMGLTDVKFKFGSTDRGWTGDVPQVRFDVKKINDLGWHARYTSDEAVYHAIKDILAKN